MGDVLPAGTVVGDRFEVLAEIPGWRLVPVYEAHDRLTDRGAVLKLCDAREVVDRVLGVELPPAALEKLETRVLKAAAEAAAINHPAVAGVLGWGRWERSLFVGLEHVSGVTVRAALEGGAFEVARARTLVAGLLDGLAAVHERGLVHGWVSPEDVLLAAPPERLALLDTVLRPAVDEVLAERGRRLVGWQRPGWLAGAPCVAPERQGRGRTQAGDVFAAARLLVILATGEPAPASLGELLAAAESRHAVPAAWPREPWAKAVARALAARPSRRPHPRALAALLRGQGPESPPFR